LQYPDMASTVEADLRQLRLAMSVYARMDGAIQQDEIYKELAERLREELDYTREAAQMRLYELMLANVPEVHVPTPIPELSTDRLLTMSWLDGRALMRRLEEAPPPEERNRLAAALFKAWYVPFYRYGVIHGDPHLGNYQVRPDATLNLLDFGAIRVFAARFVRGVIDLFEAVRDNDEAKAHHAYESWGFTDLSKEKMAVLNEWARFLYEPLTQDRVRRITDSDDPQFGRAVAQSVHEGLKRTGGVRPPREFVLMDRSAIGLGAVFLRLGAELNWSRMFHELIADFDTDTLAARQAAALAEAKVPATISG
jgi:predicted unusual protein kinase regulating ubiquinone biosynthesis (AarF/ABC1/UbiB family)